MTTLDLYVLRKTSLPLVAAIAVLLAALLLARLVELLDLVVNHGGPFFLLLKMLAGLIPASLGLILPCAFFLGVLLTLTTLRSNSELDAIQSAGVSLVRLMAPLMGVGAVLMLASAAILGFIQPYYRYADASLYHLITNTAWDLSISRGDFVTGFGDRTIVVDDISSGNRLSGIFINEPGSSADSVTITAERGTVFRSPGTGDLVLHLHHGVRIDAGRRGEASRLAFDELDFPLGQFHEAATFRPRGEGIKELTLIELWQYFLQPTNEFTDAEIKAELNGRLVRIATILLLPALAFTFGIGLGRSRGTLKVGAGLVLLVLYQHALQFGETLAKSGQIPAAIALWLPFLLLGAFSIWGLAAGSAQPRRDSLGAAMDWMTGLFVTIARRRAATPA